MNIYIKLSTIKQKIECPKTHESNDGTYKFRKVQDIIEALKPFEEELGVLFYCTDEIVEISRFPYVKSTVHMVDLDNPSQEITATSSAREDIASRDKGPSQQTGAATSYARKTAFDALLGFSDEKDPDERSMIGEETSNPEPKTDSEIKSEDKANSNPAKSEQSAHNNAVKPQSETHTSSAFVTIEEAAAVLIEYKPEAKKRGYEGKPISILNDNELQRITTAKMVTERTKAAAIALLSFKRAEAAKKDELPNTPQEAIQVCVEYNSPEDAQKYSEYTGKPLAAFPDNIIEGFARSAKVTEKTRVAAQIIMTS